MRILPPEFLHFGGKRHFWGLAKTVKCFEDNSRIKELAETAGRGRLIVADAGASLRCAMLGDVIAETAWRNDWAGIVIWGAVRDRAALGELDLGILALGSTPRKSVRRGEGQVGIMLQLQEATISSGDLIVCDEDGALVFPASHILANGGA